MADPASARQQIVDKIKDSSNILVTVSRDPSVDELSAALGLTIMLNKLKKHVTAVVSGAMPPAITFLEPEKTFEGTVDSLRDFIIALDKEKADHLRYKVDGDVVKIFITPYRTTITEEDLDFSQGDYNVELVLALGVKDEAHIDAALEAHGKILHDATVATISAGGAPSTLSSIDWRDDSASGLSEMLVSLSEAIKADKPPLDEQIATALLTGIVAVTERFSNDKTSSKVMTMAAQLMAAGANQQLIATKLQEAREIPSDDDSTNQNSDGTTSLEEGESTKLDKDKDLKSPKSPPKKKTGNDGTLSISHEKHGDIDDVARQVAEEQAKDAAKEAEAALQEATQKTDDYNKRTSPEDVARAAEEQLAKELQATLPTAQPNMEPLLGGTLNATTEEAEDAKRREEAGDRNRTILTHGESGHVSDMSTAPSVINSVTLPNVNDTPLPDVFGAPVPVGIGPSADPLGPPATAPSTIVPEDTAASSSPLQTLADLDANVGRPEVDARAAVDELFQASAAPPEPVAAEPGVAGLPPLPDFSTLPPPPAIPMPPLPGADASLAQPEDRPNGALSPEELANMFGGPDEAPDSSASSPAQDDPSQFKIPGQS